MDDRQDSSARETARKAASTYEQRFGALIPAVGGIVSQPMVLFDLQGQLGLCEAQLVFLTHVFNRRRDDSLVWVSLADIAAKTGRSLRTVKGWERSLVKLGYIDVRPGRTWRGKQGSNLVDVRPLLARLERLGRAARLERAQSELQLPAPIYDHGEPELVREPPAQRIYAQRTPTGNPVTDRANAYRKSGPQAEKTYRERITTEKNDRPGSPPLRGGPVERGKGRGTRETLLSTTRCSSTATRPILGSSLTSRSGPRSLATTTPRGRWPR